MKKTKNVESILRNMLLVQSVREKIVSAFAYDKFSRKDIHHAIDEILNKVEQSH